MQQVLHVRVIFIQVFRLIDMVDFNGMSTRMELFYTKRLGNYEHCTFIFIFFCALS